MPPVFPTITTTATAMTRISNLGKLMADHPTLAGAICNNLY